MVTIWWPINCVLTWNIIVFLLSETKRSFVWRKSSVLKMTNRQITLWCWFSSERTFWFSIFSFFITGNMNRSRLIFGKQKIMPLDYLLTGRVWGSNQFLTFRWKFFPHHWWFKSFQRRLLKNSSKIRQLFKLKCCNSFWFINLHAHYYDLL